MSKPRHHIARKDRPAVLARRASRAAAEAGDDALTRGLRAIDAAFASDRSASVFAERAILTGPHDLEIRARYRGVMRGTECFGVALLCAHADQLYRADRAAADSGNVFPLGGRGRRSTALAEARVISRWIRRHAAMQWPAIRAAMLADPVLVAERNRSLAMMGPAIQLIAAE